jgi:hypothetical protein
MNLEIPMEYIGYILLALVALCWLCGMILGMIAAFPIGLIGLVGILGVGFLFAKVVKDRLENREDDHYTKHVDK